MYFIDSVKGVKNVRGKENKEGFKPTTALQKSRPFPATPLTFPGLPASIPTLPTNLLPIIPHSTSYPPFHISTLPPSTLSRSPHPRRSRCWPWRNHEMANRPMRGCLWNSALCPGGGPCKFRSRAPRQYAHLLGVPLQHRMYAHMCVYRSRLPRR